MNRAFAYLALTGSVAVASVSAYGFIESLNAPQLGLPRVQAANADLTDREVTTSSRPFLAIYGSPAEPQQSAQDDGASVKPFEFVLKGLIAVGDVRWAVLSHEGVDVIVREGEFLEGGAEVIEVRAEGIEIATETGPMVLGFNSDAPVAMARMSTEPSRSSGSAPKGNFTAEAPKAVLFQDMTSDEILAALEQAEERRVARGWVTSSD